MGSLTYFCPSCWAESADDATECPRCGFHMADFDALPYESKLIGALKHPIRENRMLAIQLLGDLESRAAVPAFGAILREEDDPYVLGEMARSLARIDSQEARVILSRMRSHRSAIVRDLVEGTWREWILRGS
jgi:hypothetical protein